MAVTYGALQQTARAARSNDLLKDDVTLDSAVAFALASRTSYRRISVV